MMWKMGIEKQIHNAPIQNAQPRIKNEKSARINTAAKNILFLLLLYIRKSARYGHGDN